MNKKTFMPINIIVPAITPVNVTKSAGTLTHN
jgi:hypothetical protein